MNSGLLAPLPKLRTKRASIGTAARTLLFGRKYISPKDMAKIRHLITESGYAKTQPYLTEGGIGKSIFRNLFGMGPNRGSILKARLQQGGLFGKGGVMHGDIAFDPQLFEDIKKFRQGDRTLSRAASIATEGGTGLMNVAFTAGAPLLAAAAALKGEASGADVASEGLSALGQSLGAPFGMVGAMGGGAIGTALGGLFSGKDEGDIREDIADSSAKHLRRGGLATIAATSARKVPGMLGSTSQDANSFEAPEPEIYLPQQY